MHKNAIDLTDERSGRLVAVKPTAERRNGQVVWECKCDCGKISYVSSGHLKRKAIRSCGCLKKETSATCGKKNAKDITGYRSGRLIAIRPTTERKNGKVVWECKCDCGKIVYVMSGCKRTISCGCSITAENMTRHSILSPDDIPIEVVKIVQVISQAKKILSSCSS